MFQTREKTSVTDYEIHVFQDDILPDQSYIDSLRFNYDVIFFSAKGNSYSDGYYNLPKLKEEGSTGYDVGIEEEVSLTRPTRISLGMKSYMQPHLSIEGKVRSSTFKKHEIILSNSVMEIDSDYRATYLAECIPLMKMLGYSVKDSKLKTADENSNRIDYFQLKIIPVHTHLVTVPYQYNVGVDEFGSYKPKPLKFLGVVSNHIYDNVSLYFPTDRKGGFGSTDKTS